MKAGQTITVQLRGSEGDDRGIRLSEFLDQLRSVMASLRKTEMVYFGKKEPTLFYRIIELSYNSPAKVVLEVEAEEEAYPAYASHVVRTFSAALRRVDSGRTLGPPNLAALESYRDLAGTLQKHISGVSISVGSKTVSIDSKFKERVNQIIGPDELALGSISGVLESVNLHKTTRFVIYPDFGPPKVAASFAPSLRNKVKESLDQYVTVYGSLRYKGWNPFPHAIDADDIDPHPPNETLPKLSALRGFAPELTGGLSSVDFVEKGHRETW